MKPKSTKTWGGVGSNKIGWQDTRSQGSQVNDAVCKLHPDTWTYTNEIPVSLHQSQKSHVDVNAAPVRVYIHIHRFIYSSTSETAPITSHTPRYHHSSIPTLTSTPADVALTNVAPADDVYDDVPFADVAHADVAGTSRQTRCAATIAHVPRLCASSGWRWWRGSREPSSTTTSS